MSAIIEGLGTTYIENFNGVKDILPILTKNLPKALGAKESISETIVDEMKDLPFIVKDLKTVIRKASEGTLEVELSSNQLEFITNSAKKLAKSYAISLGLIFSSIFYLLYGFEPKEVSIVLFLLGFGRLLYR